MFIGDSGIYRGSDNSIHVCVVVMVMMVNLQFQGEKACFEGDVNNGKDNEFDDMTFEQTEDLGSGDSGDEIGNVDDSAGGSSL